MRYILIFFICFSSLSYAAPKKIAQITAGEKEQITPISGMQSCACLVHAKEPRTFYPLMRKHLKTIGSIEESYASNLMGYMSETFLSLHVEEPTLANSEPSHLIELRLAFTKPFPLKKAPSFPALIWQQRTLLAADATPAQLESALSQLLEQFTLFYNSSNQKVKELPLFYLYSD